MDEVAAFPPPPKRRRSWLSRIWWWIVRLVLAFIAASIVLVAIFRFVPPPVTATMIGSAVTGDGLTKDWMSLDAMDPLLARAAIAGEDDTFCQHHGFNFTAMQKAFEHNQSGKRLRGGSTISQQTAKNVFLWQSRSYVRKGLEAWFTVLIEAIWGKRRIMEVYLNVAETGIGTFGMNAGAQRYFHHSAEHLTAIQAPRLAAVLPLPKKRGAVAPKGFTLRYSSRIATRMGQVHRFGLDRCVS